MNLMIMITFLSNVLFFSSLSFSNSSCVCSTLEMFKNYTQLKKAQSILEVIVLEAEQVHVRATLRVTGIQNDPEMTAHLSMYSGTIPNKATHPRMRIVNVILSSTRERCRASCI